MKRSMFATLPLVAALVVACSEDPTDSLRNGPDKVVSNPGFLVIDIGASEIATVQLQDEQGNALAGTITASPNNAAVVGVAESLDFRNGLGKDRLTSIYFVTALSIDSSSVRFSAGGKHVDVPVLVSPLDVPSTLNPLTGNLNDLITITAVGFKFLPTTEIVFGGFKQHVESIAADSGSITIRAGVAGTGPITYNGIAVAYLPSVGLNLDSPTDETFGPGITSLAGTDALATAPVIDLPLNAGETSFQFSDAGPFNNSADCTNGSSGVPCRMYKFTLSGDGDFDVSVTWDNTADLGIYFTDATNADAGPGAACDQHGAGANPGNFETCHITLSAGTYFMQVGTYAAFYNPPNNVDPTNFTVTVTGN